MIVKQSLLKAKLAQLMRVFDKYSADHYRWIRLNAEAGSPSLLLQARSSDRSMQLTLDCIAAAKDPIDILVPAKDFQDIVAKLKGDITLGLDELLALRAGKIEVTLDYKPGSEWGGLYVPVDGAITIEMPFKVLPEAFNLVSYAAATVDNRPSLMAAYVEIKPFDAESTLMTIACADGYRLAVKSMAIPYIPQVQSELEFTFYAEMWEEWARLHEAQLKKSSEGVFYVDIPMHRGQDKVTEYGVFRSSDGSTVLGWKYIKERFPTFASIAPTKLDFSIQIKSSSELKEAVEAALIYGKKDAHVVSLNTSKDGLLVSATKTGTQAKIETSVEADAVYTGVPQGNDPRVQFDGRLLNEALDNMPEQIVMTAPWPSHDQPWIIRPDGDETYKVVLMPFCK